VSVHKIKTTHRDGQIAARFASSTGAHGEHSSPITFQNRARGQETVNLLQNTPRCAFTDDVNYIMKKGPFDKIIYTIAGLGVPGAGTSSPILIKRD